MHPVIENISARQNKAYPFKDRRKIALVLFGGLMTGVRGAGAVTALFDLGLSRSFDAIYTISAGFCNASYMLSGQPRLGSSIYYEDLISKDFIHFSKIWNMVDTGFVVNIVKNKKSIDVPQIAKTKTKFYAAVTNVDKKRIDYLELHKIGARRYFNLLDATISIPYFHPGSVKIGRYRYKDYPFTSFEVVQKHLDYALNSDATDVFVIYNNTGQVKVPALLSEKVYEIMIPQDRSLGHFEIDKEKLKNEWQWMYDRVRGIFPHLRLNKIKKERPAQGFKN